MLETVSRRSLFPSCRMRRVVARSGRGARRRYVAESAHRNREGSVSRACRMDARSESGQLGRVRGRPLVGKQSHQRNGAGQHDVQGDTRTERRVQRHRCMGRAVPALQVHHGDGEGGYAKGEKVTIKANLVGCISTEKNIDPQSYEFVRKPDYMNTSPQVIVALLRQLVEKAGVVQQDISVGDTLALFPKPYYDICRREFPDVQYLDCTGGNERHPRARIAVSATRCIGANALPR